MLLDKVSASLGLDESYLKVLAQTAHHRYKTYRIPKRSSKGFRTIDHPARELKLVQRWLVDNVFSGLPVHESVYSYRKGVSIRDLALKLRRGRYLLRMDFRDFFPSITATKISKFLRQSLPHDYTQTDIRFIVKIVCKDAALTIGAPSSPILSNAILFELDQALTKIAESNNATYCRYADDLYFSSSKPCKLGNVEKFVTQHLKKHKAVSLTLNKSKTVHSSRKHRRAAVGLILTPTGGVSLGRDRKRAIKTLVFRFMNDDLDEGEIQSLKGLLSYANSIEPNFLTRLRKKYGKAVIARLFR